MQHPAHGGDGGILDGLRLFSPADVPMGRVCAKAAALIHAARRGGAQYGVASVDKAAPHNGATAFIHRFGFRLNEHIKLHKSTMLGDQNPVTCQRRRAR